jgi:6-phosphogluconolactonase (cycloisomerase 2 family)
MTVAIRMVVPASVLALLTACGGASQSTPNLIQDAGKNASTSTDGYTLGGTVAGLTGNGLVLGMTGGSDLPVETNGAFAFPGSLASGTTYSISIKHQPAVRREICTVTNGSAVVGTTDISNVSVNCTIAVGFVYVVDENNQIAVYGINPGTGAPIPDGSFAIPPSGGNAPPVGVMVAAPGGNYLYVLSQEPNQISTFAIDPNQGGLTPINAPVATAVGSARMVMSPNGAFLFVYNIQTNNIQTVQTFTVDPATGALTPAGTVQLQNTNCTAEICPGGGDFAVRSDSKYLYLLTYDGANDTTSVTPYAIDPVTGRLTSGTAITFPTNAAGTSMSIDPLGRFLYVAKAVSPDRTYDGTSQSATVVSYILDPLSGAPAPGSSTVVANGASWMAPDPTGEYLYVIYSGCCASYSNVIALAVDGSNGALSQVGSAVPIGTTPNYAACDPSGAFLFLGNEGGGIFTAGQGWNDLTSFTIATGGVNAGTVSLSGQGTQFPSGTASPGAGLAIVE